MCHKGPTTGRGERSEFLKGFDNERRVQDEGKKSKSSLRLLRDYFSFEVTFVEIHKMKRP